MTAETGPNGETTPAPRTFVVEECTECSGNGTVPVIIKGPEGRRQSVRKCYRCGGRGFARLPESAGDRTTLRGFIQELEELSQQGGTIPGTGLDDAAQLNEVLEAARELDRALAKNKGILVFRGPGGEAHEEPEIAPKYTAVIADLRGRTRAENATPRPGDTTPGENGR